MQTPNEDLEGSERDLARKLLQQVAEWRTGRTPVRMRTSAGVMVERRTKRHTHREAATA